jgi:hypothetical protein
LFCGLKEYDEANVNAVNTKNKIQKRIAWSKRNSGPTWSNRDAAASTFRGRFLASLGNRACSLFYAAYFFDRIQKDWSDVDNER